jgi:carboxypeptidase T
MTWNQLRRWLAGIALFATAAGDCGAEGPGRLVEIAVEWPGAIDFLVREGFDLWEVGDGRALVCVSPGEHEALVREGFKLTERPLPPLDPKAVDGYLTFAEYEAAMQARVAAHPGLVSLSSIGQSHEGRELWMLKISDNVALDETDEPEVLLFSLQHAREWLSGMTLLGIVDHLLDNYGTETRSTQVVDSMQLYVILVANPDGYVFTHTNDRLWRKNRRNNGNGTFGVDLNRNFPYRWASSSNTSSTTWGGPSPLSEPENIALDNWVKSRGTRLVGCINYHSYGNLIMHSWAWTTAVAPGVETMGPLVNAMANAMRPVHNQTFVPGSWGVALGYTGAGVTDDTFHAVYGVPTLTLEVRPRTAAEGGFVVPGTTILPTQQEHIEGAFVFLDWALTHGADSTPPILSNVQVLPVSASAVDIRWATDDPATRSVRYGRTPDTPFTATPDRLRGQQHTVRLTGLTAGARHYARAVSENLAGDVAESDLIIFRPGGLDASDIWAVE